MPAQKKPQISKDSPEYKLAFGIVVFLAIALGTLIVVGLVKLIQTV